MGTTKETIEVNGQHYDVLTGLPVASRATTERAARATPRPPARTTTTRGAQTLHAKPQRSRTLHRKTPTKLASKQSEAKAPIVAPKRRPSAGRIADVAQHPKAQRFHKAPAVAAKPDPDPIAPATVHPRAARAHDIMASRKTKRTAKPVHKPAAQIKQEVIAKAMTTAAPEQPDKATLAARTDRKQRRIAFGLITAGMLLLVGTAVWSNLPAIAVKMAALRSDVAANYPHFIPTGYAAQVPIDASGNEIAISFASAASGTSFTLSQAKSSWDSAAVRAEVERLTEGKFLTTQDRGLTIYTYDGNAMWVNKGILYRITGTAELSNEYIRRIANGL